MDADMGGTEIFEALRPLGESEYPSNTHVFVLTDGQVNNTDCVVRLIEDLNTQNGIRTHFIGVGDGVSHDLIKRGAQYGGGYHIFVMKE